MKNVRMFEVVPGTGIMCTELGEMSRDDACQRYIDNEPRFRRGSTDPTLVPEQWLRNKLSKNNGWSVIKSVYDDQNERFAFEVMINAQTTEWRYLTHEDVCKSMHWKSFTFEGKNRMNVRFVDDPSWLELISATPVKQDVKRGRKIEAGNH